MKITQNFFNELINNNILFENTPKVAVAVSGLRKDLSESVNFGIKAGQVNNVIQNKLKL